MKVITIKNLVVALLIISAIGLVVYKIVDTKIKTEHTKTISDQIQIDTTLAQTSLYTMQIDTTFNLYVFKPNFSEVKLEIGKMPSMNNDSIAFCAAAAYTSSI